MQIISVPVAVELAAIREALAEQRAAGAGWDEGWDAAVEALHERRRVTGERANLPDEVLVETREAWRAAYVGEPQTRGQRALAALVDALA